MLFRREETPLRSDIQEKLHEENVAWCGSWRVCQSGIQWERVPGGTGNKQRLSRSIFMRCNQTSPTNKEFPCGFQGTQLDGADDVWRGRDIKVSKEWVCLHEAEVWLSIGSEQKRLWLLQSCWTIPPFAKKTKWRRKALLWSKMATELTGKNPKPQVPFYALATHPHFSINHFFSIVKSSKTTSLRAAAWGLYSPPSFRVHLSQC